MVYNNCCCVNLCIVVVCGMWLFSVFLLLSVVFVVCFACACGCALRKFNIGIFVYKYLVICGFVYIFAVLCGWDLWCIVLVLWICKEN